MDATHPDRYWFHLSHTLPDADGNPPGPGGRHHGGRWLLLGLAGSLLFVLAAELTQPLDAQQELTLIRHQAEQGETRGQLLLGLRYDEGQGVRQDPAEARRWLERAALKGDAFAADRLGSLYAEGRGGPQDRAGAVRWWRQAAEGGVSGAERRLGLAYLEGSGIAQDDAAARRWLTAAAAQGDAPARAGLAEMVREGRADPALLESGSNGFDRFASDSHSRVMRFFAAVGDLLRGGLPALTPGGDALTQRAGQGDVVAQYQLAWRYRTGAWGEPRDDAKALHWFRQAADNGNRLAMQSLATIYEQGLLGTAADAKAAERWHRRAQETH